ncbi:hypothetical protein [Aliikangiella sp. G2MR2-5]|uniref:LolA family protein n=1 Tax=Aliikangiella sp. G2MR2-5 TaxID=2788943 RepID=UPI0018A99EBF|nr:hypothetical protein [Aliikangiella sp. G2MR2-5]
MKSQDNLSSELNHYVEVLKSNEPSEKDMQRMEFNLQAAIAKQGQLESANEEIPSANQSLWQKLAESFKAIVQLPSLKWGGAAASLTAFMISIVFWGGNSSVAFAEVVAELQKITSMRFVSEMKNQGNTMMQLKVFYRQPGQVRIETTPLVENGENATSINVLDTSLGKGVIFLEGPKMAMPFNFEANDQKSSPRENPLFWFDAIHDYDGPVTELGWNTVNGVDVYGLSFIESGVEIILWADKKSHLPVQVIVSQKDYSGQESFSMTANVEFNIQLASELFSLEIDSSYITAGDENK